MTWANDMQQLDNNSFNNDDDDDDYDNDCGTVLFSMFVFFGSMKYQY